MCRAVWVVVLASSGESLRSLRRAVGVEAQVVATATTPEEADAALGTTCDVVIVDAALQGAADLAARAADRAVVWVGDGLPAGVTVAVSAVALADELPGAIGRALIARR